MTHVTVHGNLLFSDKETSTFLNEIINAPKPNALGHYYVEKPKIGAPSLKPHSIALLYVTDIIL